MSNVLKSVSTRLGMKLSSITSDETKVANLTSQIAIYQNSLEKLESGLERKREEAEILTDLMTEAQTLAAKEQEIFEYTQGLRAKFDAIEWRPDLPWEDRIESTDYTAKVDERARINSRLEEIEKEANKTYYRR